eukprot:CAMPEP_0202827012 /NCGR_PEP_ID=MMETSP1389-20130828/13987_1 /ASSEMBLY_ACC=CAM_ASM_000865 /TAXON_ID=302021 /ORGANISM="Rhodomonas sp., Strain CCMP768" /LENGTH=65 /DNA_ID=CAMNT_0049500367 /DNA_START=117 /DNA_END=314 /DNA_ORIENTATION=-
MFELCCALKLDSDSWERLESLKQKSKWASHVSYSNDVMLVDERTDQAVLYDKGHITTELPYVAPY